MITSPVYLRILLVLFSVGWSLADSDLIWPSPEIPLFNDNGETTLAFGLNASPISPLDDLPLSSSSLDESSLNSLFENSDDMNADLFLSNNNPNQGSGALIGDGNQSFELADCSSSSLLFPPVNGKFRRAKRIDGSPRNCQNPASTPGGSGNFFPARIPEPFEIIESLERSWGKDAAREELKHHSVCVELTFGVLPWGACSNPDPRWTYPSGRFDPYSWLDGIKLMDLDYCTARTYNSIENPRPSPLLMEPIDRPF